MGDQPHPADYMSDAQYEQFMRDGGISGVSLDVEILNYSIAADEELLIESYSGAPGDCSDRVREVVAETEVPPPAGHAIENWLEDHEYGPADASDTLAEYRAQLSDAGSWIDALRIALRTTGADPALAGDAPINESAVDEWLDSELDGGEWITIADGEVAETGEFHPYRVHVQTR